MTQIEPAPAAIEDLHRWPQEFEPPTIGITVMTCFDALSKRTTSPARTSASQAEANPLADGLFPGNKGGR